MRWPVVLIALAGCRSVLGIGDFHTAADDGGLDAEPDAQADATIDVPSDSLTCLGTLKSICFTSPPSGTVAISGAIATGTDPRCASYPQTSGGPDLCVIAADTITVGATTATGARPLVLVAMTGITVNAALDVSSGSSGLSSTTGAGAGGPGCTVTTGASQNGGGGGGGGGGLGLAGAVGGRGANNGAPGVAGQPIAITQIRGGCPGGKGGDGDAGSGGAGGDGGGAVVLIAGTGITIASNGALYASAAGGAAGGQGGANRGAGGGGGSGGLIVLEAPSISLQGTLAANGGAGGGGADGGTGQRGSDGEKASFNNVAQGGQNEGGTHGGDGGDGGAVAIPAAAGMIPQVGGGGGGGGGGVGVIWVHGAITGATRVSPAVQQH